MFIRITLGTWLKCDFWTPLLEILTPRAWNGPEESASETSTPDTADAGSVLKTLCSGWDSEPESLAPSLLALWWWLSHSALLSLSLPMYKMEIMMILTYLSVMWGLTKAMHIKHLMCFWHIVNAQLMLTVIMLMRSYLEKKRLSHSTRNFLCLCD